MVRELMAVAVGAAVGALLRWVLPTPSGTGFPWSTFAVNVTGSLLLALLLALTVVRSRPVLLAGLGPGVLGGFTTVSAYAGEARLLVAEGHPVLAAAYVLATVGACLLGVALVRCLRPGARA